MLNKWIDSCQRGNVCCIGSKFKRNAKGDIEKATYHFIGFSKISQQLCRYKVEATKNELVDFDALSFAKYTIVALLKPPTSFVAKIEWLYGASIINCIVESANAILPTQYCAIPSTDNSTVLLCRDNSIVSELDYVLVGNCVYIFSWRHECI